jgi:hypothetical protein
VDLDVRLLFIAVRIVLDHDEITVSSIGISIQITTGDSRYIDIT